MGFDLEPRYQAVMDAISTQNLPELKQALDTLDANEIDAAINEHGNTFLMYAVSQGKLEASLMLLERGADVNKVNKNNKSALGMIPKRIEMYGKFPQQNAREPNEFFISSFIQYGADLRQYPDSDSLVFRDMYGVSLNTSEEVESDIIKKYAHIMGLQGSIMGRKSQGSYHNRAITWLHDSQEAYLAHLRKNEQNNESLKIYEKITEAFELKNTSVSASITKLTDR
jgi:hypothetical protein